MRNAIFILFIITVLISCRGENEQNADKTNQAILTGLMNEGKGQLLYLQKMTSTGYLTIDSTLIDDQNSFIFRLSVPNPGFYALKNAEGNHIPVVCKEKDSIKIIAGYYNFRQYELTGSAEAVQISLLNKETQLFLDKLDSIAIITRDSIYSPDYSKIKSELDKEYRQAFKQLRDFSEDFLNQNKGSLVSLLALSNQLGQNFFVFHPKKDFKIFQEVDSALIANYPDNEPVISLHQQVLSLRNQLFTQNNKQKLPDIYTKAPEIALPSPNGILKKLSDYKGKIVLLDFWASWCPPCRRENPNLVKMYSQYADEGFEIFQVSLDKSHDLWEKAIADDGLGWVHVSDLKYWDSEVAGLYGISSIPANFLIDKDGIIIARNISLDELKDKLEEIFNE